jgi:hypothetical protein
MFRLALTKFRRLFHSGKNVSDSLKPLLTNVLSGRLMFKKHRVFSVTEPVGIITDQWEIYPNS